jgi:assimilatory nitrate reductase catalytic subunit
MVAAADLLCEQLEGTRLTELHGGDAVSLHQGALNAEPYNYRIECEEIVREAFRDALSNYRVRTVGEFRGENPLICTCFGIAEDTIVSFIETMRPADVDEVSDACNAGSGCGSCRMLIAELIDGTRR